MPIAAARPPSKAGHSAGPPRAGSQRRWVLDVPFSMRGVAAAAGARWDAAVGAYLWSGGGRLPDALVPFSADAYSWAAWRQAELNGDPVVAMPPAREIVPRDYQRQCSSAILAARRAGHSGFLNADDVGLGKTIETWDAILAMDDVETVLVVCPLAAVAAWRQTIRWMGDRGKRVVVVNYDRLKSVFDVPRAIPSKAGPSRRGKVRAQRRVRTLKGAVRYGSAPGFDVLVIDECQKIRNASSARAGFVVKLRDECGFTLWLSATAGQNPVELSHLAPILCDATGSGESEMEDYVAWCKSVGIGVYRGDFGRIVWRGDTEDGAQREASRADLDLINAMLFSSWRGRVPVGIRRKPEDIAGWPSVNRILIPVDLTPEDRVLYDQAWSEFRASAGLSPAQRAAQGRPNPMVERLRFQQKASLLRTAATVDLARTLLEQGQQVAVSCFFKESSDAIVAALASDYSVTTIDGRLPPQAKEANRRMFQAGSADVVVYSVVEAINLHQGEMPGGERPRSNLIHDLRYSSIDMKQIEGRTHRDGRFSRAYWLCAAGTVEERIAEAVAVRLESMSLMQGDDDTARAVQEILERYRP